MIKRPLTLPPVRPLIALAAKVWNTTEKDILSTSRLREHARPRQAVCYLAVASGRPKSEIANVLGRDRKTILYGARKAEALREMDGEFAIKLNRVERLAKEAAAC
ncbi:MAG: hypothetical protein CMK96_03395 [Pseudomonas sp.]|nr:hypothetical protein [Pseudomonas sp.]